jgi:hypothetical protein
MKNYSALAALAVAAILGTAASAQATIFIGLKQNAGALKQVASGASSVIYSAAHPAAANQFESIQVIASSPPTIGLPNLLQTSASISNSAGAANAGTLKIYITSTGNTIPLGNLDVTSIFFASSSTTPANAPGWTETLQTYIDPGNGKFTTTTLLSSEVFGKSGSATDNEITNSGPGPYSVTAVYTFKVPSRGSSSATINLSAVGIPEPGTLALLGSALAGFGVVMRRRQKGA